LIILHCSISSFLEEEPTDEHFWINQMNTPKVNTWMGLSFERVCLMHIDQIKRKLGISGVLTEENAWYCKKDAEKGVFGSQIDMLIVRKDQVINLCEMKYSRAEYTITSAVNQSIQNKIHDLILSTGTKYAIFSNSYHDIWSCTEYVFGRCAVSGNAWGFICRSVKMHKIYCK